MKAKKWLVALLAALLALACIGAVACSGGGEEGTKYTVTYVDITADNATLKTEEVEAGGKATEWTPTKEGYNFDDWYATPDMLHEFDFDSAINQNTTVYGYFTLDTFEEDTRDFYILGTSSDENSVLYGTNYKIGDESAQKLTKAEKTGVNEYTITLDLYLGDTFQFAINDDFENQRGFGYFDEAAAEGYFEGKANFLDPNPRKADVVVNQAGNYTLTLTTHPWSDEYETTHASYTEEEKENFNFNVEDTVTFVRNGDPVVAPSDAPLEIYIKGAYITGWGHDTSAEYTMTYDEENDVYTYSHEFVAGDAFMFYNFTKYLGDDGEWHNTLGSISLNTDTIDQENSDVEYLDLTQGNITVTASGTYSFVYDRNTNSLVVTYDPTFTEGYTPADTWYVSGSGITEPLKSSAFGNNLTDAQKLEKIDNYTYEITLDLARGDLFQIVMNSSYGGQHGFADIVEPVKDGETYFALAGDGNNARVEVSGNYTLTLNLDDETPLGDTVTWVRNGDIVQELPVAYDVFMKTQPDEGSTWIISERHSTGTDGMAEGVVEFRAYFTAEKQFCFIYYEPGVPDDEVGSYFNPGMLVTGAMIGSDGAYNDNFGIFENNFVCEVAGFYIMRIDFNGGEVKVDFVGYQETMPEFEAIIKGNALEVGWDGSERVQSSGAKVEMVVEFIKTGEETLTDGQFGFSWWDDSTTTGIGNWIGVANIGTSGDANSLFVSDQDTNNFVASVTGTYKVVIDMSSGTPVVDFYSPDWEVIVKGTAFDVGWDGTGRLPVFGNRFELEYEFIEDGEFGFTIYGKTVTNQYGDYVGWAYLGTSGDANGNFSSPSGNNIVCDVGGTYKIVIDFSGDEYVLDFYLVD